ncbi:MAG: tetratricopeptide repeat protein [Planctomycetes bacterium]|nr:tetratricopeptide repeat protein [Planctomycetota bacterium]
MDVIVTLLEGKRWVFALVVIVLLAGVGLYLWQRPVADIPEFPLDRQDPAVAKAIQEARDAVVKSPRSADAWGQLGSLLLANQVFADAAYACFLEAERLDPKNPRWPYFAAGYLVVNYGRPAEAVPLLERSVTAAEATNPPHNTPRLFLAETLLTLGRVDEADRHFQTVRETDRNNVRALFGLGRVAVVRGRWDESRAVFERCLGDPRARKRASIQLAAVCEHLGNKPAADVHSQNAERLPKDADWFDPFVREYLPLAKRNRDKYRIIDHLEAEGKFADAIERLALMANENPDDDSVHIAMGNLLGKVGRWTEAEVHLRLARKLAPQKIQPHYLLAAVLLGRAESIHAAKGDEARVNAALAESVDLAQHALKLRSDYGLAHMILGRALRQFGQREAGLKALREAAHCSPQYSENHLFLGQALAEDGNNAEARVHLQRALLFSAPDDTRAKDALDKLDAKGK